MSTSSDSAVRQTPVEAKVFRKWCRCILRVSGAEREATLTIEGDSMPLPGDAVRRIRPLPETDPACYCWGAVAFDDDVDRTVRRLSELAGELGFDVAGPEYGSSSPEWAYFIEVMPDGILVDCRAPNVFLETVKQIRRHITRLVALVERVETAGHQRKGGRS